jgi:hypothetical protein
MFQVQCTGRRSTWIRWHARAAGLCLSLAAPAAPLPDLQIAPRRPDLHRAERAGEVRAANGRNFP